MLKDYITTDPGEEAHSRKFLDTSTTSYSEITKGAKEIRNITKLKDQ